MKLLTIIGARPQFIKASAVSLKLSETPEIAEIILHTGQHFDENMSQVFFDELNLPKPVYNLGIGGGSHGQNTGRMIEGIEAVLVQEKPDCVLVYGDTDSTLAGAIASVKLNIPVAHVEAGLRSYNRVMPEEINRVLTDHASDLLFAPTRTAVDNLRKEGIDGEKVRNVGDVMFDAAVYYGAKAEKTSRILEHLTLKPREYILATIHRAENTDKPNRLETIMRSFNQIAKDIMVIAPLHPRTKEKLSKIDFIPESQLRFIEPVGYLDMIMLEKNAKLIATDSGGVQKEAFFHRVPCITLRAETEWIELVELGWNRLSIPDSIDSITEDIQRLLNSSESLPTNDNPYGNGDSASLISYTIKSFYQ